MNADGGTELKAEHTVEFPRSARVTAWVASLLMLVFAAGELEGSHAQLQELVRRYVGLHAVSGGGVVQFDLRSMTIEESLLGWAGSWATLIGLVWLICAVIQRRRYNRDGRELGSRSKVALMAVACGLVLVFGVLAFEVLALSPDGAG
jgi:hypothetical protein